MVYWSCGKVHGNISQWHLIVMFCVDMNYRKAKTWFNSFKTVNIHPHHCFSFEEWVHCIISVIRTGKKNFYCTYQYYYYDACPAVWNKMEVEDLHYVISIISLFVYVSPEGKSWMNEVVAKISCY